MVKFVVALILLAALAQTCSAVTYSAVLTGAADNITSSSTGTFNGVFSDTFANYTLTMTNIVDAVQGHLHLLPPGTPNGPVVVWLFNSTVGYITVPGTATVTGSFTAADLTGPLAGKPFSALLDALTTNSIYVNLHSKEYPSGFIRATTHAGALAPAPAPMSAGAK